MSRDQAKETFQYLSHDEQESVIEELAGIINPQRDEANESMHMSERKRKVIINCFREIKE